MPDLAAVREGIPGWFRTPLVRTDNVDITLLNVLGVILVLLALWWLAHLVEQGVRRVAQRNSRLIRDDASAYVWARILRYLIWALGALLALSVLGVQMTSLWVVGGIIGFGIGFGLQNLFNNLISGIVLMLEKTLKIGDFVDLESGVRGHVLEIGMRYTRINTNDGVDVIVPNSEFTSSRVVNWTFDDRLRRMRIPFSVAYGTNKDTVKEAGIRAANAVDSTFDDDTHKTDVWLVNMGESGLDFVLAVWVGPHHVGRPANTQARYLWAIHDELERAGIAIPFPQRDVHLRWQDDEEREKKVLYGGD
ncbi:mechanosensitive ion channel family protein [Marinimicrobium alkaliphilum]|uniref:mechanosensitive ion channel family protein n=1 Tax=Marinimicrobium alkaliphilum TaxID=2202654 RepID=UPI000DBA6CB9|nr:mechanosensitive ion channel domain-containing protein [Marinimicrobium alkaliphilum]